MRFSRVKVAFDMVPAGRSWNPKWPCRSTSVGITVLPEMSTRIAPGGTGTSPRRPIWVNRLFSTMKAEFSIGALPSPVMRRAPSNTVTGACTGACAGAEPAIARIRPAENSSADDSRLVRDMGTPGSEGQKVGSSVFSAGDHRPVIGDDRSRIPGRLLIPDDDESVIARFSAPQFTGTPQHLAHAGAALVARERLEGLLHGIEALNRIGEPVDGPDLVLVVDIDRIGARAALGHRID